MSSSLTITSFSPPWNVPIIEKNESYNSIFLRNFFNYSGEYFLIEPDEDYNCRKQKDLVSTALKVVLLATLIIPLIAIIYITCAKFCETSQQVNDSAPKNKNRSIEIIQHIKSSYTPEKNFFFHLGNELNNLSLDIQDHEEINKTTKPHPVNEIIQIEQSKGIQFLAKEKDYTIEDIYSSIKKRLSGKQRELSQIDISHISEMHRNEHKDSLIRKFDLDLKKSIFSFVEKLIEKSNDSDATIKQLCVLIPQIIELDNLYRGSCYSQEIDHTNYIFAGLSNLFKKIKSLEEAIQVSKLIKNISTLFGSEDVLSENQKFIFAKFTIDAFFKELVDKSFQKDTFLQFLDLIHKTFATLDLANLKKKNMFIPLQTSFENIALFTTERIFDTVDLLLVKTKYDRVAEKLELPELFIDMDTTQDEILARMLSYE